LVFSTEKIQFSVSVLVYSTEKNRFSVTVSVLVEKTENQTENREFSVSYVWTGLILIIRREKTKFAAKFTKENGPLK
jgi:preprotein translocase subunit SecB